MSRRAIFCPKCKTTVAEERPASIGKRLRVIADLAYGEKKLTPGFVVTICPTCGATIRFKGRLSIEPT